MKVRATYSSDTNTVAKNALIGYSFKCPGCGEDHTVYTNSLFSNCVWGFNGNVDKPTFTPSLLIKSGHYVPEHKPGDRCWCTYNAENPDSPSPFKCGVCHSFITDGKIQFLNDCTHHLAGQTIELSEI